METTIKTKGDLPNGFDIEKYAPCKSFGVKEWACNLARRTLLRYEMGLRGYDREELSTAWEYTVKNPIIGVWDDISSGYSKSIFPSTVREVDILDYFAPGVVNEDRFAIYQDKVKLALNAHPITDESVKAVNDLVGIPVSKMLRECGINDEDNVNLVVDLSASEERIIADFSQWLRKERGARGSDLPRKDFGEADFELWSKMQVLAYLDLTFWAKLTGVGISNQLMALTLFPNEYEIGTAERVRKVVSKLADRLIKSQTIDALCNQANGMENR